MLIRSALSTAVYKTIAGEARLPRFKRGSQLSSENVLPFVFALSFARKRIGV
jgi:hypothetical protein